MTTSFNLTRTEIAQRVAGKVLKIGATTIAPADAATIYQAIDLRLKEMHEQGIFWRKVTSVPVTFSLGAGIASASAGAGDILFPIKCTFSNTTNDDPVRIIGMREYAAIPDKTTTGNPTKVLWRGGSEFIFHPVPVSNGTAKLLYEKIADDTSADAAIDVDVAMIRPMMDIIKYDVADDYGVPEQTQLRWKAESKEAQLVIRKLAVQHVDTTPVQVDDFGTHGGKWNYDYGMLRDDY